MTMMEIKYAMMYFFLVVVLVEGGEVDNEVDGCLASSDMNSCTWAKNEHGFISMQFNDFDRPIRPKDVRCCTNPAGDIFLKTDKKLVNELLLINNHLGSLDLRLFANFSNVETLNLTRSNIESITWENCPLTTLKTIDFSFNNLSNITEDMLGCNPNLMTLNMIGNSWNCPLLFEWFIDWAKSKEKMGLQILGKNNIYCVVRYDNNQLMSNESLGNIINSCPEACSCKYKRKISITIDCTGQNLTEFPTSIIKETLILILDGNKIRNFHKIINDSSYRMIVQLSLKNNQIESLTELESVWRNMQRLTTLDLEGNRIKQVQPHVFRTNVKFTHIMLGRNPWDCDCLSATALRKVMNTFLDEIKDRDNITCSASDPKFANRVIQHLTYAELCHVEKSGVHYLDVISSLAGLFIIILLTKLIYDGWHFKRKGKLPMGPKEFFLDWRKNRSERKYRKSFDSERESIANNSSA